MKHPLVPVVVLALMFAIVQTTQAQKVEYLFSIGTSESGNPSMRPTGIAVDDSGMVIVSDNSVDRIHVFDCNGSHQYSFGMSGSGSGQLDGPIDLAVSPTGNIHVAEINNQRLQVFDSSGNYLWHADLPSPLGESPLCIAVDFNGITYVDGGQGNIYVFNSEGEFQFQFGAGQLERPHGIAINSQGNICIADDSTDEVFVFDNAGNYLFQFGSGGSGDGQFDGLRDIAIDSSQRIFTLDQINRRIQVFDDLGNYLFQFVIEGDDDGQSPRPGDLAIDENDQLYVSDGLERDRIQVFQILGAGVEFLYSFGEPLLDVPAFLTGDPDGKIYVSELDDHEISVFDSDGSFLFSFGEQGEGDGQFDKPGGIELHGTETIYVADQDNGRVQVFQNDGTFLQVIGTEGSGDGQLNRPYGIALDLVGRLHVAERGNDRVSVFDNLGVFQFLFGSQGTGLGQFDSPNGIAVDENGDIYVADRFNDRVQVFDSSGSFLRTFGTTGAGSGQFNGPFDIALDGESNIYVSDRGNGRVQIFNNAGEFQFSFGMMGYGEGELLAFAGIYVSGNLIYVCDSSYGRVQVFQIVDSNPDVVVPDSVLVTRGTYVSGGTSELSESDNADLSLRRATSDVQSRTEFEVKAVSPNATPSSVEVTLEGAVFARSEVFQTIELYDYVVGNWELLDSRPATRFSDSVATVAATGDLSRFVEAGTLCMESRIRYQSTNPRQQFSSSTDQFIWAIGQ